MAIELVLDASVSLAWFLKESPERAAYAATGISDGCLTRSAEAGLHLEPGPAQACEFVTGTSSIAKFGNGG